jgi:hypothetical protein
MKYEVAVVTMLTDQMAVKRVDTYQNALLKNDENYIKLSNVAADVIREALANHNKVFLPKNISGEMSFTDVIIVETEDLDKEKMMLLSVVYRRIDYQLFMFGAIDFYDFLNLFNKMTSLGYFITDENREEKYIEIIETGDEELISLLESYLERKDKLDTISHTNASIKHYEKIIEECETLEALEKIKNDFHGTG